MPPTQKEWMSAFLALLDHFSTTPFAPARVDFPAFSVGFHITPMAEKPKKGGQGKERHSIAAEARAAGKGRAGGAGAGERKA